MTELGLFGEEKVQGRPCSSLPVYKGGLQGRQRDFLQGPVVLGQRIMDLKRKRIDLD